MRPVGDNLRSYFFIEFSYKTKTCEFRRKIHEIRRNHFMTSKKCIMPYET